MALFLQPCRHPCRHAVCRLSRRGAERIGEREAMEPSRTRRTGRLARLIRLALDLGIASFACYGRVLAGLDTLPALPAALVVAAVWVGGPPPQVMTRHTAGPGEP
ncbi:hypothetical protein AB0D38_34405, partial [Streptomyces sp. NPDC048279]|uniref:hypothetical protein n=1 Tax=Streptomyces sp. NPDC048279 TaxID=3154714 RepID=UPI0034423AC1